MPVAANLVVDPKPQYQQVETCLTAEQAFDSLRRGPGDAFLDSGMRLGPYGNRSLLFFSSGVCLQCHAERIRLSRPGQVEEWIGDPFVALRGFLADAETPADSLHESLCGGVVGYLGYDLGHFVETLPCSVEDDLGLPDLWVHLCPVAVTFDHDRGTCHVGWTDLGRGREETLARKILGSLRRPPAAELATVPNNEAQSGEPRNCGRFRCEGGLPPRATSNFAHAEYVAAVERAKEYILAGDIYQVNLSQRFSMPLPGESWGVYRRLRVANPAPFAAYLDGGSFQVLSASPERFLHLDPRSQRVHTRPIKGTRPRAADAEADRRNAEELLASEKDCAEHVMIVDLERNDLGRVVEVGTVRVSERATLETFPTVHHLTSTIEGVLGANCDRVDLLRATFPGGSITGAPKIRSMEIIDELEPTKRGVYTGSLGYFGFDGSLDLSIVIRTIVAKEGVAHFHAGGGIVADSDPEAEYQETLDKARALTEALGGDDTSFR